MIIYIENVIEPADKLLAVIVARSALSHSVIQEGKLCL